MNKKKTNRVIIIVFLGALYGLTVMGFLKPEQQFSDYENRYLQTRPQFSAKSFFDGSFAKDYEAYISDQFIGRNEWIALKTGLELARGMKDTGGVYFGSDDYFFQKSDAGLFTGQQARLNMDVLPVFLMALSIWKIFNPPVSFLCPRHPAYLRHSFRLLLRFMIKGSFWTI